MHCWQVGLDIFLPRFWAFASILVNASIISKGEPNGNKPQPIVQKHNLFSTSTSGRNKHPYTSTACAGGVFPVIHRPYDDTAGTNWRIVSRNRETDIGLDT